jgi:hypothetical protein
MDVYATFPSHYFSQCRHKCINFWHCSIQRGDIHILATLHNTLACTQKSSQRRQCTPQETVMDNEKGIFQRRHLVQPIGLIYSFQCTPNEPTSLYADFEQQNACLKNQIKWTNKR